MPILFEVFLSTIRIFLLFSGVLLTLILGQNVYFAINSFLKDWAAPCLEIISYLVVFVPVLSLFYGVHIKKAFWKRERHYNNVIFLAAFAGGVILTLLPLDILLTYSEVSSACSGPSLLVDRVVYAVATGTLSALFAFVGMDIGVLLKHSSHRLTHNPHKKVHKTAPKSSKKKASKK